MRTWQNRKSCTVAVDAKNVHRIRISYVTFGPPNPSRGRGWAVRVRSQLLYILHPCFWTLVCWRGCCIPSLRGRLVRRMLKSDGLPVRVINIHSRSKWLQVRFIVWTLFLTNFEDSVCEVYEHYSPSNFNLGNVHYANMAEPQVMYSRGGRKERASHTYIVCYIRTAQP